MGLSLSDLLAVAFCKIRSYQCAVLLHQLTCARCISCLCFTFPLCLHVSPAWGCGSKVWLQVTFSSVFACPPVLVCSTASGSLVMLPRALSHQESEAERRAQLLRLVHLAYGARRVRFHHPGWHFLVQSVRESSRVLQYLAVWSWQQLLATSEHVLTHLSIALFQ